MTAPTPRETADPTSLHKVQTSPDHAKLLAGKACGDRMLAVADALMPWLKNYPPSTRRERAIEAANAAIAASCAPLLSEIAALRGQYELDGFTLQASVDRATQAERQRDEAVGLLRRIVETPSAEYDDAAEADAIRAFLANQGADQ